MVDETVEEAGIVLFGVAEGTQDDEHRHATLAGHTGTGRDGLARLLLDVELDPFAAVGVDGARDQRLGIATRGENDSGRPNQLRHHNTLGAIDDERALVGHHGEVTHEHRLFLDFAGACVHEPGPNENRGREGHVALAALFNGEFWPWTKVRIGGVELEFEPQRAGEIFDRRDVSEGFSEAMVEEPFEGRLLDTNELREWEHFVEVGKGVAISGGTAGHLFSLSAGRRFCEPVGPQETKVHAHEQARNL